MEERSKLDEGIGRRENDITSVSQSENQVPLDYYLRNDHTSLDLEDPDILAPLAISEAQAFSYLTAASPVEQTWEGC